MTESQATTVSEGHASSRHSKGLTAVESSVPERPQSTALVLTGGGARGAYEAGVLQYIYESMPRHCPRSPLFDLYCGTSAGALNACTVAALAHNPESACYNLSNYWRSITMDRLLAFGYKELRRAPELMLGSTLFNNAERKQRRPKAPANAPHPPVAGLFDTSPLFHDMSTLIPWQQLQANLVGGLIRGVAVCATEVCTSRPVIFYQMHAPFDFAHGPGRTREARSVRLNVEHAMASSAIPFLFPAIQVDGVCYVDGALRQNTPIYPALRMGADRMLMIGLSRDPGVRYRSARMGCRRNPFPGSLFLLGRTVNALVDGVLDEELHQIEMFNRILENGRKKYGEAFLEHFNDAAEANRNARFRPIRSLLIRPSKSLNKLAFDAIRKAPEETRLAGAPGRLVSRALMSEALLDSELSSFLLFTPTYVRSLLELGYQDAKARHDELVSFFSLS
ncbi:MAG: patatin-like phospholipase family protein [Myxococcota bacterium]|nr:patatin-like phospholipase family protein [Myxococcota bacterium]